jgi:hypothetical protein
MTSTAPIAVHTRRAGIAARLALTVAIVYGIHFAPNVVRETYLAVAIAERLTVRVDPFLGLHPDLFEIEGRGAYINNNPGASFIGAVPYAMMRPLLETVYRLRPSLVAPKPPATYDDPRPNRTNFMNEMRARGLDVRLAAAAAVIHAGLNVPLAALAAVMVFFFLSARIGDERKALWLTLLFAFGTPIFFRSAFLNQNLMLAYCTLYAFLAVVWRPRDSGPTVALESKRLLIAGVLLGVGLLCDYSAMPLLAVFGLWVVAQGWIAAGLTAGIRAGAIFTLGAAPPIFALLWYQYAAFGNPWLPAQAYMPSTALSVDGWNGVRLPLWELLWRNLFDLRYGLFAFCPMLAAAVLALVRRRSSIMTRSELMLIFGASTALYLFSSSIAFALLQWNTGVRYLVPAVPLLFLALATVLVQAPRWLVWVLIVPTVTISWAVAMTREDVPTALLRVFLIGFELPWHTVLQKTAAGYMPVLERGGSPIALFVLIGVVLVLIWRHPPLKLRGVAEP